MYFILSLTNKVTPNRVTPIHRERKLTRPDYKRHKRASLDQPSVNSRHSLSYPTNKRVSRQTNNWPDERCAAQHVPVRGSDERCTAQHVPVRGSDIFTAHQVTSPNQEYSITSRGLPSDVQKLRPTNICSEGSGAAQHVPPHAQHILTHASDDIGSNSNISNISNLTPRTRRRLFNRRRDSERGGIHRE